MKIRSAIVAIIVVLSVCVTAPSFAQQNGTLENNLFSQYTTYPGVSQATAGMYPAPYSVPNWVGSTNYTNQALMPHEFMYSHRRNYYNYYAGPEAFYKNLCNGRGGGGALNKTTVVWQNGCNHMGQMPFNLNPLAGLSYNLHSRYYCLGGNCGPYRQGGGSRIGLRRGCATGNCGVDTGCASGDCGGYVGQLSAPYQNVGQAAGQSVNFSDQGYSR